MKFNHFIPIILAFILAVSSSHLVEAGKRNLNLEVEANVEQKDKNNDRIGMNVEVPEPTAVSEPALIIEEKKTADFLTLGYYTKYWSTDYASYQSLKSNHSYMNAIATATYDVMPNGSIEGIDPTEGIKFAKANGLTSYVTIQNKFDPDLANQILTDVNLRKTTITNMLELVKENEYQGINLNFENMYASDRAAFNQFVIELVEVFHANDFTVIVSVPAKTDDFPTWEWSGTFEYSVLGEYADYIQLMSYDQHGSWGEPGPVAGVNWMEDVLTYATSEIPSKKLLIGLPAYAYDWNEANPGDNQAITWNEIEGLVHSTDALIQWDDTSESPYFHYTDANGDKRTVWFENEKSIEVKTDLVHKYNLAGVSMWRMGQEDESFWKAVENGLSK
jgi:spore germination protein YaaH